jgi:hypothetical protein
VDQVVAGNLNAMESYISAHESGRFKKMTTAATFMNKYCSFDKSSTKDQNFDPLAVRFIEQLADAAVTQKDAESNVDECLAHLKSLVQRRPKKGAGTSMKTTAGKWLAKVLIDSGVDAQCDIPPTQVKGLASVAVLECFVERPEREKMLASAGGKFRTALSAQLREAGRQVPMSEMSGRTELQWVWPDGIQTWQDNAELNIGDLKAQAVYHADLGAVIKLMESLESNKLTWITSDVKATEGIVNDKVAASIRQLGRVSV